MKVQNILTIAFVASMLGACATTNVPVGERESVRQELNDRTDKTLALLLEKKPELQASLDTAVGYFVARLSGAQVAVIGGAVGMGVLYDKEAASRTYMNVTRYDLGLGAGAGAFRVVVLFQTRETLEQFRSGTWRSAAGAETAAGTAGAATPIALGEGSTVHAISESGAIVAATQTDSQHRSDRCRCVGSEHPGAGIHRRRSARRRCAASLEPRAAVFCAESN
jgi:lipid-binding SYLF domain-containing protein